MNKAPSVFSKKPVVIFLVLALFLVLGVAFGGPVKVDAASIVPSSVTIAVGGSIQFHAYDGEVSAGETTTGHAFFYDPFYVQESGSQTGYFTGVNPGTVTIVTGNPPVTATITVTGSPATATGTIQIATSKDIYKQMFPVLPNCGADWKNCRFGRMDSYDGGNFKVNNSFDPPVLMTDQMFYTGPAASKSQQTGPWAFTLQDPMNPVQASFASPANEVNTWDDWAGDFGPSLSTYNVAFSKDGSYQFIQDSYGRIDGWHNGVKKKGFSGPGGNNGSVVGVIDRGYKTFLITNLQTLDVTDFDTIPTVHLPPRYQYNNDGTPIPCTAYCNGYDVPGPLPKLPSSFPIMPNGKKFILSNENYVASFEGQSFKPTALKIYDLGKSFPVATLSLSADIPTGRYAGTIFQQKRDADTDYLVMILTPSGAGSGGAPSVYVYKFNFTTKTLTKGVDGALLKDGTVNDATGFNVGNGQRGVIVFTSKATGGLDSGGYENSEGRARAYLYTDLADKVTKDVLSNSPVTLDRIQFGPATSLVSGNSTYVYSSSRWNNVFAWKLDLRGATSSPVQHRACVSNACTTVSGVGTNSCSADADCTSGGGGTPPGGGALAGSCDFTLTPTPASIDKTVPSGQSSYISIGLSTTKPVDTTCPVITISLTTLRDTAGNTVATPLSSSLTISPGNSTVAIYNVSKYPGSYTLPIKAYGRGVQKTVNVGLNVQ